MFIFIIREPTPATAGSTRTNAKERREGKEQGGEKMEEKGLGAQRVKPCIPTPAVEPLIGDEEQTGKKKSEQRKKKIFI